MMPQHVAVIMDGNGRWAAQKNLPRSAGHQAGGEAVRRVVSHCRKLDIPYLTLYAFSQENWRRPTDEINFLFDLLVKFLKNELNLLQEQNIRLNILGDVAALPRTLAYLDALEAQGRFTLMVWPVHCEVGSWGHGIHADVLAACGDWQLQRQRAVRNVFKGTNPWTEHYSAIEAEVPDADDTSTALNTALLQSLGQADVLLIAGEASSHCVRSTTEHIVQHLPRLVPDWQASRIVLLTDGMSPVAGFEAQHQAFLDGMRKAGAQLASMSEISL